MCFPVSFTKFLRTPFYMKLFRCPFFSNLGKKWKNERKAKQNNNSTLLVIHHSSYPRKKKYKHMWTYININVYIERTRVWPWFSHSFSLFRFLKLLYYEFPTWQTSARKGEQRIRSNRRNKKKQWIITTKTSIIKPNDFF